MNLGVSGPALMIGLVTRPVITLVTDCLGHNAARGGTDD